MRRSEMRIYSGMTYRGTPYAGVRFGGTHRGAVASASRPEQVLVQKADRCANEPINLEDVRHCRDCAEIWHGAQANCPACWSKRADVFERKQIGLRVYLIPVRGSGREAALKEYRRDVAARALDSAGSMHGALGAVYRTWTPGQRRGLRVVAWMWAGFLALLLFCALASLF